MRITAKPSGRLGHRKSVSAAYYNTENIYLSEEGIDTDATYAESIRIIRYTKGLCIKAVSCDGINYIELEHGELTGIRIIDPDEYKMPKRDKESLSTALFGWAQGLSSLHDSKLKIGGRVEFEYKNHDKQQQIILYHGKQDIFDLFKYMRKHFSKYIL